MTARSQVFQLAEVRDFSFTEPPYKQWAVAVLCPLGSTFLYVWGSKLVYGGFGEERSLGLKRNRSRVRL